MERCPKCHLTFGKDHVVNTAHLQTCVIENLKAEHTWRKRLGEAWKKLNNEGSVNLNLAIYVHDRSALDMNQDRDDLFPVKIVIDPEERTGVEMNVDDAR